jgi:hypothetical protein
MFACTHCKIEKCETEFWRERSARGHRAICKDCASGQQCGYYAQNRYHILERTLANNKLPHVKERRRLDNQRYRQRFPEKVNAALAVHQALQNGWLIKPKVCSICGLQKDINAHHDDYLKTIDVRWLCRECHGFIHRKASKNPQLIEA